MAVTAAQLVVEMKAHGARETEGSINRVSGAVDKAAGGFDALFASIQGGAGAAIRALDGVSKIMGSLAVMGGVSLIVGGAKAGWAQVSAVEQATVALKAYESSASAVDDVLGDLVDYARSDMGVLFQRQDLFAAAQGLKVMGAETKNLTDYVEIMSRSVGVGAGTWQELSQVIGRVGSTGRIMGDDFDMLTKMGYQLDSSLRNVNVTWDELFSALDRGIPVNAMEGQASTIEGMVIRIQSAIRGIGTAFLGVDADTSRFISGGLGDQLTSWLADAPALIKNFQGAAAGLGNTIADIASVIGGVISTFQSLPSPIQTAVTSILKLVTAFGALRVAGRAMGMLGAMTGLGGLAGGLGGLMGGGGMFKAGTSGAVGFGGALASLLGRITPVGVALTILGGAGIVVAKMMGDNKRAAEEAAEGLAAYEAAVQSLDETIRQATLAGDLDLVRQLKDMHGTVEATLAGIERPFEESQARLAEIFETGGNGDLGGALATFLDTEIAQTAMEWARENTDIPGNIIDEIMSGNADAIGRHGGTISAVMDQYYQAFEVTDMQKATILTSVNGIFDLMQNDLVDTGALMSDFNAIWADFGQTGDASKLIADLDALYESTLMIIELGQGQVEYDYMAMLGLTDIAEDIKHVHELHDAMAGINDELSAGQQQAYGEAWEGIFEAIRSGEYDSDAIIGQIRALNYLFSTGQIDGLEYGLAIVGINQNLDDFKISAASAGEAANGFGQAMADAAQGPMKEYEEQLEAIHEMLQNFLDVTGQGDLASRLNLLGIGGESVSAAAGVLSFANSLDTLFRVVVGNTDAIGSQSQALADWAEELIGVQGEYSKLDDLVNAGRITGRSGVFDDGSEYALAQQAYNSILEDNAAIQEHILTIQAKQAPLLAANAAHLERYMGEIAEMSGPKQLAALGFMDAGLQDQLSNVIDLGAQMAMLGPQGEETFLKMAQGIAATNPALFSMMESVGLVTDVVRNADGTVATFDINLDGATTVQDSLDNLTLSIDALTVALGGVPPLRIDVDTAGAEDAITRTKWQADEFGGTTSTGILDADGSPAIGQIGIVDESLDAINGQTATVNVVANDQATGVLQSIAANWGGLIATSWIDVVTRNVGGNIPGRATGGIVNEPMTLVGENGPELVSLPYGSEVFTASRSEQMMRSSEFARSGSSSSGNDNRTFSVSVNVDASGKDIDEEKVAEMAADRTMTAIGILMDEQRAGYGMV